MTTNHFSEQVQFKQCSALTVGGSREQLKSYFYTHVIHTVWGLRYHNISYVTTSLIVLKLYVHIIKVNKKYPRFTNQICGININIS